MKKSILMIITDAEYKKRLKTYAAQAELTMTDIIKESLELYFKSKTMDDPRYRDDCDLCVQNNLSHQANLSQRYLDVPITKEIRIELEIDDRKAKI